MQHRLIVAVLASAVLLVPPTGAVAEEAPEFAAKDLEFFEKKIRPLFVERCGECHSGDEPAGGLRLDSRDSLLRGGDTGPAIVPGDAAQSELILAVTYDPSGYQMPPDGKLPDREIELLKEWVNRGAPWRRDAGATTSRAGADWESEFARRMDHWSLKPLVRPAVPAVEDEGWCLNPVDRFVLQRIHEAGLVPAAPADRSVWLRRVSFDVTGLPPTLEELEEFLGDETPDAEKRVIDRLLASPHYGERWGRHWLDLVRYAESRGHEFDFNVANAWQYRDYVIRALNADVSYDRFVVEHVAGDLLSPGGDGGRYPVRLDPVTGANESVLGTGFWFLGEWVHSPVDIRQEEADRFDNMIDVYSKTFLGLTVACARCHDHKFDPIPQSDFYALQGYLQSSSYRQVRFETAAENEEIARQLDRLRREAAERLLPEIERLSAPVRDRVGDYFAGAKRVLESGEAERIVPEDRIIADFESGDYSGWTVTGNAFGERPQTLETIASYQGKINGVGTYFVNSHHKRDGGRGDDHVGRMTSDPFVIDRAVLRLLVGGGAHVGKTCVNLLVDGKSVRTATGRNDNQMSPVVWDVAEFRGRSAQIEIVDDHRGGWGNIGVDHIVLSDRGSRSVAAELSEETVRRLGQVASAMQLDESILTAWTLALADAADSGESPLADFAGVALGRESEQAVARRLREKSQRSRRETKLSEDATWIGVEDLIPDGAGFVLQRAGDPPLVLLSDDPALPVSRVIEESRVVWDNAFQPRAAHDSETEPGATESWQRAGRLLKTPTFEIAHDRVWCLVRGAVHTYVAVDSHILIRGPLHGSLARSHAAHEQWRWIEHNVSRYRGHRAHLELIPQAGKDFELAGIVLSDERPAVPEALADAVLRADVDSEVLGEWLLASCDAGFMLRHPALFGLESESARHALHAIAAPLIERQQQLVGRIRQESGLAPAMLAGSPEEEYVFIRGNWKKRGERVPRRFLSAFSRVDDEAARRESDRLDLALQMVDPQQTPIVARVIVNRLWLHLFGRGLVPTPDNFGYLGQPPSHPDLLDWLAVELVEHDWSLKHVLRVILSSNAYRMSSLRSERAGEVDPGNVWLSHMNLKRLEGEVIRDALLALSGRLDRTLGGKSIPVFLTPFMEGRGRPGTSGPLDGFGRRSVYIAVRRNFPDPFFQAFDFPTPHSTIGRRNVSNVPAQALAMMNHPLIREQSARWSTGSAGGCVEGIHRLYRMAFSRDPSAAEIAAGRAFLDAHALESGLSADDPAVWADYAHALVNSKEFLFVQ